MLKKLSNKLLNVKAREQGLEPQLPGPEPGVLPLDDPRKLLS